MNSEPRKEKLLAAALKRPILKILILASAVACAWSPTVFAQKSAPLSHDPATYRRQLPARPPAGTYPEYRQPAKVSSVHDLFWEAIKEIESGYSQWNDKGLPKPGLADPQGVISIGMTQIRFDDGTAAQAAKRAGLRWTFSEYVYNPVYNEKIGRNHFEYYGKYLDPAFHPCASAAIYNWGIGNGQKWRDGKFSSTGTAYHWDKKAGPLGNKYYQARVIAYAKKKAVQYGMQDEMEKTIRTTPGCLEVMADIDTTIMKPGVRSERPELPVIGYCHDEAARMVRAALEGRQYDYDMTYEPLMRQIKSGPGSGAQTSGAGGQPSGGGSGKPSSGGGSGPGGNGGAGQSGSSDPGVWEQSMADLSACTATSWPSMKISYPSMDQIIRGVGEAAVRKVCGEAREAVSQYESALKGKFYINTRIPGVPNAGIDTGAGDGGVTIKPGGG